MRVLTILLRATLALVAAWFIAFGIQALLSSIIPGWLWIIVGLILIGVLGTNLVGTSYPGVRAGFLRDMLLLVFVLIGVWFVVLGIQGIIAGFLPMSQWSYLIFGLVMLGAFAVFFRKRLRSCKT